jgi:Fe-S-cluster-containing dehydrogenase component
MIFGDLDDKQSELNRLLSTGEAKPLKDNLKVDPSVFYLREKPLDNGSASG